jgi:uncharacterized protein (DUF1330 family)
LIVVAYWIARAHVRDAERYAQYAERAPEILAAYGGRVLARGGRFALLEGDVPRERFVVVEFPTLEAAQACHASPEYQAAAAFRRSGAGDVEIVIVEGVPTRADT